MKRTTWFVFLLLLSFSCLDQPDCFQLNNNIVGVSFRVIGTGDPDTVGVFGVHLGGTDSVFLKNTLLTRTGLPLNYKFDQTEIIFERPEQNDTLLLGYSVGTQFVSEDCGARYILSDIDLLKHTFDSVRIVSRSPGRSAQNNIEIFRCPGTGVMNIAFRQLTVSATGVRSSTLIPVYLNSITPDFSAVPLYENSRTASVYLPLDTTDTNTMLAFSFTGETEPRELFLSYNKVYTERYKACGEQIFLSAMKIDNDADFDSVSFVTDADGIPITTVLDPPGTMMQIYRCPVTNLAGIDFMQQTSPTRVVRDTVVVKNLSVSFPATVLYPNDTLRSVNIPLDPSSNSTTVTFEFDTGETKTITLTYTRTNTVLFNRCDEQTLFSNLQATSNDFDSVMVSNNSLSSIPVTNIEIIQ